MKRGKLLYLLIFTLIVSTFNACEKVIVTKEDEEDVTEDTTDYLVDTTTFVQITLNSTSITVDPPVATVSGSKVTITEAATYSIKGTLDDGQIIVNTKDDASVKLVLNGVNIKCSNSSPIFISKASKTIIILNEGTQNYLSDGTSYVTVNNEPNAAIFSNSYLSIYGEGSLTVTANYQDGISSDDGLLIKSGTISVTSADDGIRGKDYLIIRNGNITVKSKGDGLKSSNEENSSLGYISIDTGVFKIASSAGDAVDAITNLTIKDGKFIIGTGTYAATAFDYEISETDKGPIPPGGGGGYSGTISEKGLKAGKTISIVTGTFVISSADDAIHTNDKVTINDGTFTIASGDDAIHADASITVNKGTINISKCYEGFESASITVNDGTINLVSTDDAFNATKGSATEWDDGSCIYINGGNILLNPSTGDGLDSNGNVVMTAGTVVVHGPQSSPEVGIDVNGSFNISGGLLFVTGPNSGNMIETVSSSSVLYSVKVTISSTLSSSTLFHIQDESGNALVTYKPVRTVYYVVYSSSDLKNGSVYSIYTGGTSTGTLENGLYSGGIYSGGTLKKNFTISGKITSISF